MSSQDWLLNKSTYLEGVIVLGHFYHKLLNDKKRIRFSSARNHLLERLELYFYYFMLAYVPWLLSLKFKPVIMHV